MKFPYKTIVMPCMRDNTVALLEEMTKPCCERMSKAIEGKAVRFGFEWGPRKPEVCILHSHHEYDSMEHDQYVIDFCPFCGEKIECVETMRTRRVEKVVAEIVQQLKTVYEEVPDGD